MSLVDKFKPETRLASLVADPEWEEALQKANSILNSALNDRTAKITAGLTSSALLVAFSGAYDEPGTLVDLLSLTRAELTQMDGIGKRAAAIEIALNSVGFKLAQTSRQHVSVGDNASRLLAVKIYENPDKKRPVYRASWGWKLLLNSFPGDIRKVTVGDVTALTAEQCRQRILSVCDGFDLIPRYARGRDKAEIYSAQQTAEIAQFLEHYGLSFADRSLTANYGNATSAAVSGRTESQTQRLLAVLTRQIELEYAPQDAAKLMQLLEPVTEALETMTPALDTAASRDVSNSGPDR